MKRFLRSIAVLLLGIPALTAAALFPLPPAFGEGGARRDVIRHAAESAAESAAPASLSRHATVMDREGNVLRQGTNGWMCLPDNLETAGNDPICMNEPWVGFMDALKNRQNPTYTQVGIAYMLQGDRSVSNTDPFAKEPKPGEDSVEGLGAHIMVLVPDKASLKNLSTNSKNGGPWVMWAGSPYAHIMIPIDSYPAK